MDRSARERGGGPAALAALAVGLGCLLAYSRAFASGLAGALPLAHSHDAASIALACSIARVLAIAALTLSGVLLGRRAGGGRRDRPGADAVPVPAAVLCGAALCASAIVLALDAGTAANLAAAAAAGGFSGAAMLGFMLRLSGCALRDVVLAALGGLSAGGLLIMGLMRLDAPCASALLALSGLGATLLLAASARCGGASAMPGPHAGDAEAGDMSPASPWFAAVMFAASGIVGSMLYGIAGTLGWNASGVTNYPLFGVAAVLAIGATSLLVLRGGQLLRLSWLPQFTLLLLALVLSCFADQSVNPTVAALLLASVFSYHFLRWMVFPALISASRAPRLLACGTVLLLTSSFLNVNTGAALAWALPEGLRLQGGLAAAVALGIAVAFVAAFLVENARREELLREVPQVLGEALEEAMAARGKAGPAVPTLEERCGLLAAEGGLTPREGEILLLTARGHSSTYIAGQLVISPSTVRFHQKNIYRKLDVHDRQSLLALVNG